MTGILLQPKALAPSPCEELSEELRKRKKESSEKEPT